MIVYTVPAEQKNLDDKLKLSAITLLYSSHSYLKLLADYLDCKILWIIAEESGVVSACMPVAIKYNSEYGNVLNSLPFYGSNGGIYISPNTDANRYDEICNMMLEEFERITITEGCVSTTIITNPLDERMNDYFATNYKHELRDERIGQITSLPRVISASGEELIALFEDPRPRNIRKALKSGITIHHSTDKKDIDFLYNLHVKNISAIRGIAKDKLFFDKIPKHFDENGFRIYTAKYEGVSIAGLLVFYFNRTVEYFTPAIDEDYRHLQPAALIIFEAMKDAINEGYQYWNWGGTWLSQGGVYDFKKKWGTKDHPYYYYTRIYNASILEQKKEILLEKYKNFFVAPFSSLTSC